jgi:hypothetical protein
MPVTQAGSWVKQRKLIQLPALSSLVASGDSRLSVLTSSSGKGETFEDSAVQHGAFTWYLMEAALGNADVFPKDGQISNLEINGYVVNKLASFNQVPEISNLNGYFLNFDTTAVAGTFSPDGAVARTLFNKSLFAAAESPQADTALIRQFYQSLQSRHLFGSDSAAYPVLIKVKAGRDSAAYYEKMRSDFVKTALNEDNAIMYRYLNQDIYPWVTKYDDMEKGLQLNLALQETLDTLDFKHTEVASRYLFDQAMSWYRVRQILRNACRSV